MKKILIAGLLLCAVSSTALAAGINFYWTPDGKCPNPLVIDQTYDCLTNDGGSWIMVGSFQTPAAVTAFFGIEAIIDGQSLGVGLVPAWWQSYNAGSCRQNAFGTAASTVAQTTPCYKLWTAAPMGGIGAWQTNATPPPAGNVPLPNRLRIKVAYAMSTTRVNLNASRVYNAFNITMDASNSVEDLSDPENPIYACAGCLVPVTLVLNQINARADGGVSVEMTEPIANRCITWQGGADPSECSATPARNTTWGNVKSLYR